MDRSKPNGIHQMVPSFAQYDAIGLHVQAIQKNLKQLGYESNIYFEKARSDTASLSMHYPHYRPRSSPKNIVIYHHSTSSAIPFFLFELQDYVIHVYHNITPPIYFDRINDTDALEECKNGLRQLNIVRILAQESWTVSQYNAGELSQHGIMDAEVFPLMRDYTRLSRIQPSGKVLWRFRDGKTNFLFVGRVTPNKCQHELIIALKAYQNLYNKNARLILVGGVSPNYLKSIQNTADQLGIKICMSYLEGHSSDADVLILGQLSDNDLAAFYEVSHLFMCFSEHEGFCVPLVEAMNFNLPILAHQSTAIPETMGRAGILIDKARPREFLPVMHDLVSNQDLRRSIKNHSQRQARNYTTDKLDQEFLSVLNKSLARFEQRNIQ